jgi:hypothetical protein
MADGIRLHHPTERSCVWLVRHPRKNYFLRLDADGDVIVSSTVYERLQQVSLAGLMFLNVVKTPPTINLIIDGAPRHESISVFNPHTEQIEERKVVQV